MKHDIHVTVLQLSGIGMTPSILTSVVGAASEVVAVAEPVAWGVRQEEGWLCWVAESSLRHCLEDLCSAFGGSAPPHQSSFASGGNVQVQLYWLARQELGIPPPAWCVQWWDTQLKSYHPTHLRCCFRVLSVAGRLNYERGNYR